MKALEKATAAILSSRIRFGLPREKAMILSARKPTAPVRISPALMTNMEPTVMTASFENPAIASRGDRKWRPSPALDRNSKTKMANSAVASFGIFSVMKSVSIATSTADRISGSICSPLDT